MQLDIADGIDGILKIQVAVKSGLLSKLTVRSTRPYQLTSILKGRTTEEVLTMIPRLYASNSAAQSYAAVTAFESALGLSTLDKSMVLRNLMVKSEILYEHLLRLLYDWPRILGEPPFTEEIEKVQELLTQFREAIDPKGLAFAFHQRGFEPDLPAARESLLQLEAILEAQVFGLLPISWLSLPTTNLLGWIKKADVEGAKMIRALSGLGYSQLGQGKVAGLNWLTLKEIKEDLKFRPAEEYAQQPTLAGKIYETTPMSRMMGHRLMKDMKEQFGDGLFLRFLSRLVETALCCNELKKDLEQPASSHLFGQPRALATQGVSQIEAARGKLIHKVELVEQKVKSYNIIAPTDWNFHPKGILAQCLLGQTHVSEKATRQMIDVVIHALDPCVGFEVELS
ncbi:MAG: nickel-dependent hydrogenase large subunit [SAR324 cluster bacterium]|nr:nickel-dependent hydrogenase large subunit [SAR324 cluster bacterium]